MNRSDVRQRRNSEQNEDISDKEEEVDTEYVLHDVLNNIFSYLNGYDLNQAAQVCNSWHRAARVEKLRRGTQIMILQPLLKNSLETDYRNVSNQNEIITDFKLSVKVKPRIVFFFTDINYLRNEGLIVGRSMYDVAKKICMDHESKRPRNCVYAAIQTLGVNVNSREVGGNENTIASIFLPALPSVNYIIDKIGELDIRMCYDSNSFAKHTIDKVFITEGHHTCFIIFMHHRPQVMGINYFKKTNKINDMFLDTLLANLKTRSKPGTYSLWGGAVNELSTAGVKERKPPFTHATITAIAIFGSTFKAWSIVLKSDLSQTQISEKLRNFKEKVYVNSSSIAFVIIPSNKNEIDRFKANIFKEMFPNVTLISIFNRQENNVYCIDSTSTEPNQEMKHTNSFAFLILTYRA